MKIVTYAAGALVAIALVLAGWGIVRAELSSPGKGAVYTGGPLVTCNMTQQGADVEAQVTNSVPCDQELQIWSALRTFSGRPGVATRQKGFLSAQAGS